MYTQLVCTCYKLPCLVMIWYDTVQVGGHGLVDYPDEDSDDDNDDDDDDADSESDDATSSPAAKKPRVTSSPSTTW